jgi:hypothetical protein
LFRRIQSIFTLFLFLLCLHTAALAQSANTSLRGVVTDPSGAVVTGATVTLVNKGTGQTLKATSNKSGEFQLLQISPAKYQINVEAPGFAVLTKSAELLVGQPARVNFKLSVSATNDVVDVSSAAQTLNTTDAALGDSKSNSMIQALPSETRNITDLLSLEPGVLTFQNNSGAAALADSRIGAVNGERSDQSNVTLDGLDDNDQVRGLAFFGVLRTTQDAVEEFRVTTTGANADSGRSAGAQVSLVTKSGTNTFHGAAYEYNRPSNLVSNDPFLKKSQLDSGLQNRPQKLIRNIFGADVGGPIFKDKLFFFANYEAVRIAESAAVQRTTPTSLYGKGILQYTDAAGGTDQISAANLAILDSGCTVCNTTAYTPGPGANPNALAYFQSMPAANGTSLGDGGINTGSYTFASPNPQTTNTSIVKLDYAPSPKHRLFVRGNLQKDTTGGLEEFPGQPPSSTLIDNSKGIAAGHTWTITPNIVNDLRYAYIRQGYTSSGIGTGDYVDFRFIDTNTAETRTTATNVPVNNIVDNFSWTVGHHTLQVGANWRLVHQNRTSDANSFNSASSNPSFLSGSAPDPTTLSTPMPAVSSGFGTSYFDAFANIVGTTPQYTKVANYQVTGADAATLLPEGAPTSRHFSANEYELYAQDSWRATPNLTITYGLRYTLLQTPWETRGQEVTPNIDTHAFYQKRESSALNSVIYEPDFAFNPAGKYYSKPGFYPENKANFAPRFAIAYAPNNKTSIRAGVGLYYDHFGQGLINTFDQNGEFGLSSQLSSAAGTKTISTSPRFTSNRNLPTGLVSGTFDAQAKFPYTYPDAFQIQWGIDNHIKTPYTEAFDLSVQRILPGGFTLETAYVGRLGRHLLQSLDLTEPTDWVDPQGGGDYYTASAKLAAVVDQNGDKAATNVAAIPYWEHVFPFMAGIDFPGESATQAIYTNEYQPYREFFGLTNPIADMEIYDVYGTPTGFQPRFWQNQFASLYALSSTGMSYYNGLQLSLRHPTSHGLQFDLHYTLSKSIDFGSDAERSSEDSNGVALANSEIINTWKPYLNRAVSDFDTRHAVTFNEVYQLPFGRGRQFAANVNHLTDAFIGGWQLTSVYRWTSGLPFSLRSPGWDTDWQITGYGVQTGAVSVNKHRDVNGDLQYFNNVAPINTGVYSGGPVRLPYAGETGERNKYRGDGYTDLDSGVDKAWKIARYGTVKFAWEVYNVTNTNRIDPFSIGPRLTSGSLGKATSLLTQPRRMQFALRYEF